MEFISQERPNNTEMLNCHVISSFMIIFMKAKLHKNEKWIKLFGEFWHTIKDIQLEEANNDCWYKLGNLIENNLIDNWEYDICESQMIEDYIYHSSQMYSRFDYFEKFEKYDLYFQEKNYYEYHSGGYDDDEPYDSVKQQANAIEYAKDASIKRIGSNTRRIISS